MIAPLNSELSASRIEQFHQQFLALLPHIRRQAWMAFRGQRAEAREEYLAEVIANAYRSWVRLLQQGKADRAYATPLAQFAIRQVRAGRRVGSRMTKHDLLSPCARWTHSVTIERLDQHDLHTGDINEALVETRQAGPAAIAAARIDMAAWLATLSKRQRRIAKALALGRSTREVASQFGLCPARISQLRRWLHKHWEQFQGGLLPSGAAA
jgi:hypothetical protein